MALQIQPVFLFTEQVLTTLYLFNVNADDVVGMPEATPAVPTNTSQVEELSLLPLAGKCVEVCGTNDCDYLIVVPQDDSNGLSVSENVAKDILGDINEDAAVNVAWGPVSQSKCEESQSSKKLRKRQWYGEPEYENRPLPYQRPQEEHYIQQSEYYQETPDYYEPRNYEEFQKPRSPQSQDISNNAQTERKNVKITNSNDEEPKKSGGDQIHAVLNDPPRRTVGSGHKPNFNKGTTKKFPVESSYPKGRQTSQSETASNDPTISFSSAQRQPQPQGYQPQDASQPQRPIEEPSAPNVKKIEHPDGSIEYSFGVSSGEVSVYNEGDSTKKPGRKNKSVISSLKSSLGIDDNVSRGGWSRKSKRGVVPDEKPTSRTILQEIKGEDKVDLKESVQRGRTSGRGAGFMGANGNRGPMPTSQASKQQPQPEQKEEREPTEAEKAAAAEQANVEQQQLEYERMRRLSLKKFYKDKADEGENPEVSRDKWAEEQITEQSQKIASDRAQRRREDNARKAAGKDLKEQ